MSRWISLQVLASGEWVAAELPDTAQTPLADISLIGAYWRVFDFNKLHGMTGAQSMPMLLAAVAELGTCMTNHGWAATPGNVGAKCAEFAHWAWCHPEGVWEVENA